MARRAKAGTRRKSTYVLVHGAWHGGWCWKRVVPALRAAGHEVYTPTLTGLGERAHLANPAIDLSMHIADIVNLLEAEELDKVVLVGHSYGGMVVTGVADRAASRLRRVVYLDALARAFHREWRRGPAAHLRSLHQPAHRFVRPVR